MHARRQFRPTLWATIAALLGVGAGVALGYWQLGRAQEKLQRFALLAQRASQPAIHIGAGAIDVALVERRTVEARGAFEPRGMVLLDNRVRNGVAGFEVVMPLRLAGADMHVLVDRGWIAGTGDRRRLPEVRTPAGDVAVSGLALVPGRKLYELSAEAIEGIVWQNLTIERYRAHMPYPIQPVMIQQATELADGLVRSWQPSEREINVHRSYAFQWFALALLIACGYLFLSLRRVPAND
ncbi:MAG: SURF1 family protein [Burkholderiales bacterium]|nr:SURF1 family protein [Burkholderiales bacterium]